MRSALSIITVSLIYCKYLPGWRATSAAFFDWQSATGDQSRLLRSGDLRFESYINVCAHKRSRDPCRQGPDSFQWSSTSARTIFWLRQVKPPGRLGSPRAMTLASKEPGRGSNGSLMSCGPVVVILLATKTGRRKNVTDQESELKKFFRDSTIASNYILLPQPPHQVLCSLYPVSASWTV